MSEGVYYCSRCRNTVKMVHGLKATCAKCGAMMFAIHADDQAPDPVNAPSHYRQGGIECIDAIRAALTPEEYRGYLKGTALAYLWRERHKNGHEDCRKARWYVERLVQAGQQEGTETTEKKP